ncbi:hypothetical protein HAX54_009198 [Datura stramonium]|uniref:Uncharacterized protein n=1 Tax=Datura stramonium TaxID=4076 RepID=A0ABS8RI79_DATST|nr:hypothetical protein [Datura stramonium]
MSDLISADVSMGDQDGNSHSLLPPTPFSRCNSSRAGESLPPRKAHRRSNSDIPFGFSAIMQSSSAAFVPLRSPGALERSGWVRGNPKEKPDDLFSAYMNLDNIDAFNSSGTDEKQGNENREDLDSRASGTKINGGDSSDNEATSSVNDSGGSMQRLGTSSS